MDEIERQKKILEIQSKIKRAKRKNYFGLQTELRKEYESLMNTNRRSSGR